MDGPARPLSPYLVYRWGITNTLSIFHRLTGGFLSLGTLILACWLISAATSADAYAGIVVWYGSVWFKLLFAGWAFCFFYHFANGIRHLFWDVGRGFSDRQIRLGGMAVVAFAVVATAAYSVIVIF